MGASKTEPKSGPPPPPPAAVSAGKTARSKFSNALTGDDGITFGNFVTDAIMKITKGCQTCRKLYPNPPKDGNCPNLNCKSKHPNCKKDECPCKSTHSVNCKKNRNCPKCKFSELCKLKPHITYKKGTVLYCNQPTCKRAALGEELKRNTTRIQFLCGYRRKIQGTAKYKPGDEVQVRKTNRHEWQTARFLSFSKTKYNVWTEVGPLSVTGTNIKSLKPTAQFIEWVNCPGIKTNTHLKLEEINVPDVDLTPKPDKQEPTYFPKDTKRKCKDCGILRQTARRHPKSRTHRQCRKSLHKGEWEEVKSSGRRRLDDLIDRFIRESERCIAS